MSKLREKILEELDKRKWNPYDLEKVSGVPQPTIQRFLSGKHGEPRGDTIRKIAKGFGLTEAELRGFSESIVYPELKLIEHQPKIQNESITEYKNHSNAAWYGEFDLWDNETPLRDDEIALPFFREVQLSAGAGISEIIENHGHKLRFSKSTLRNNNVLADRAACVTVSGNSMEPVLPDGTTVGIDTSQTTITNGEMYAIDHLGELRVKLLYVMPGGNIRIKSYNGDEWPDELVSPDKIRVIGWVFWYSVLRKRRK